MQDWEKFYIWGAGRDGRKLFMALEVGIAETMARRRDHILSLFRKIIGKRKDK